MEINANRADVYAAVAELIRTCDYQALFGAYGRGMDMFGDALVLVDGKLGVAVIQRPAFKSSPPVRCVRSFYDICAVMDMGCARVIKCDFDAVVRELETVNGYAYVC